MWLACFSAITKPLRQHLPAVFVLIGFLQLFHNIWLSHISYVVVVAPHHFSCELNFFQFSFVIS